MRRGNPEMGGSFGSAAWLGVALVRIMKRWQWPNRDDYSHVLVTPPTAHRPSPTAHRRVVITHVYMCW